jgi:hypothetical protein
MKTANFIQTQVQSKIILGVALVAASCAISLAFQHPGNAKSVDFALTDTTVQQVVVEAKRMTPEEKMAYDSTQKQYASVVIVGKRLSAEEKLAMNEEDASVAKHAAAIRKV